MRPLNFLVGEGYLFHVSIGIAAGLEGDRHAELHPDHDGVLKSCGEIVLFGSLLGDDPIVFKV